MYRISGLYRFSFFQEGWHKYTHIQVKIWISSSGCSNPRILKKKEKKTRKLRQFFEASGTQGNFFEKIKNPFLDKVYGSMCTKFQVCIVFIESGGVTQIHTAMHTYTHIQVKLEISPTGCSPHVDFDILIYVSLCLI